MMTKHNAMRRFLAVAVLTCIGMGAIGSSASARVLERRHYGVWTYRFFQAKSGWRSCDVRTTWPNNNKVLMIRLMRNRIEWYFYNRAWTLKPRSRLRETEFDFGHRRFFATSQTQSSNKALYGSIRSNIAGFVRQFQVARRMKVYLPTGVRYGVNLRGARRAMDAALRCWQRNLRQ